MIERLRTLKGFRCTEMPAAGCVKLESDRNYSNGMSVDLFCFEAPDGKIWITDLGAGIKRDSRAEKLCEGTGVILTKRGSIGVMADASLEDAKLKLDIDNMINACLLLEARDDVLGSEDCD